MSFTTITTVAVQRKVPENVVQHVKLLEGIEDNNGGVTVEMTEPMDSSTFVTMLRASMTQWKEQRKKGVWIKLPIELVNLVESAVKEGFWYHHAETRYLMLVYWIPDTTPKLPANASHRVGIGAFIMNNTGEVLVVQENKGKFKGTGIWKLPTGAVNEGEDLSAAAVREVREETGIESKFLEVLAFRQSHNSFFSKSDLFFVCLLKPLSFDIQKQDSEVEAAKWMPMEEYAAQPFVQKKEIFRQIAKICLAKINNKYTGFSPVLTTSGFSEKKFYLYFNDQYFSTAESDSLPKVVVNLFQAVVSVGISVLCSTSPFLHLPVKWCDRASYCSSLLPTSSNPMLLMFVFSVHNAVISISLAFE